MVALNDLAPASFRGAGFLVPRDHASEGRNTIDHKFPNKTDRYAEDNGGTPPQFNLTCVLHGATLAYDWSRLRSALNVPGPGTLRHPWYGSQLCQVKGPWKVSRDDKDSGVLQIEVEFLVTSNGPSFPSLNGIGIAATITGLSGSAISSIFSSFSSNFSLPVGAVSQNFVTGMLNKIAGSVAGKFGSVENVAAANDFIRRRIRL